MDRTAVRTNIQGPRGQILAGLLVRNSGYPLAFVSCHQTTYRQKVRACHHATLRDGDGVKHLSLYLLIMSMLRLSLSEYWSNVFNDMGISFNNQLSFSRIAFPNFNPSIFFCIIIHKKNIFISGNIKQHVGRYWRICGKKMSADDIWYTLHTDVMVCNTLLKILLVNFQNSNNKSANCLLSTASGIYMRNIKVRHIKVTWKAYLALLWWL